MAANDDAEVARVAAAGMVGTGRIERWLTISCGSCDASDAFAPLSHEGRREATYKWAQAGWRTERPDDEHKNPWWCCPKCLGDTDDSHN